MTTTSPTGTAPLTTPSKLPLDPKLILATWICIPWLILFALRFAIESALTPPTDEWRLATSYGAQLGLSCAHLFAIALLAWFWKFHSRGFSIVAVFSALALTLLVSRLSYDPRILERITSSCIHLSTFCLIFSVYWCFAKPVRQRNENSKELAHFSIKDLLLGLLVFSVFLAATRHQGEEHYGEELFRRLLEDFNSARSSPSRLVASAVVGLVYSLLSVAIVCCITSKLRPFSIFLSILFLTLAATILSASVFFINSTQFHGYKVELTWFIETLKYQFPAVVTFAIWFTTSIYLFRSLGLLAPSQPTRTESSFAA